MDKPILISFSGGRTSAFMAKFMMEYPLYADREKVVCFANTGKEMLQTLDFIDKCDKEFNLNVVWLEADVKEEKGEGTSFKIVDYKTASRKGEPFKEVIKKYGIPNKQFPHCTRELKLRPIEKYMKSLGYSKYETAIGIRHDEQHRVNRDKDGFLYPLIDLIQVNEKFIRDWWERQPFDLELKDYEGNCDLCWKKSKRKRLTLIKENPFIVDWWNEMEIKYGEGKYQFDQKDGLTILDLVEMAKRPFAPAIDKQDQRKQQLTLFDPNMDIEWDCMCKAS